MKLRWGLGGGGGNFAPCFTWALDRRESSASRQLPLYRVKRRLTSRLDVTQSRSRSFNIVESLLPVSGIQGRFLGINLRGLLRNYCLMSLTYSSLAENLPVLFRLYTHARALIDKQRPIIHIFLYQPRRWFILGFTRICLDAKIISSSSTQLHHFTLPNGHTARLHHVDNLSAKSVTGVTVLLWRLRSV